jgi:hypothetical protein
VFEDGMMKRFDWQPGNGTRYDLICGQVGDRTMITWMRFGGSGGVTMLFSHFLHYSYILEKMQINIADAVGILMFLESRGYEVGYPEHENYETCIGEPQCLEIS